MKFDREEWLRLETVGTEEEARLIAGFLDSQGIACVVESLRFHQEPVNFGRLGEIRLRVQSPDIELAARLLKELREDVPTDLE